MIVWDFNAFVAIGITLSLGVVIVPWLFYTFRRGSIEPLSHRDYFRQCGFCGYLYIDYFRKEHGACPRCGSYQA